MTACGSGIARGWVAAGFATAVATASHVAAGGTSPDPLLLLFSLSVSGLACCLLARRHLSLGRLAAGVAASQAIFHWLFSIPPAAPPDTYRLMMAGMDHGGTGPAAIATHTAVASMVHAGSNGWQMWLGHAVAAALTILFLRFGETSVFRLMETLRLKATTFLGLTVVPVPSPVRLRSCSTSVLLPLAHKRAPLPVMHHRGPPPHLTVS